MTDLSQFHYYDQKPQFTVELRVWGTASITVTADSKEDARAQAEAMIQDEDFVPDLEEADDIDINYVSEHPTRMYLVHDSARPSVTATSRITETCTPRQPTDNDTINYGRLGYGMSWAPADGAA